MGARIATLVIAVCLLSATKASAQSSKPTHLAEVRPGMTRASVFAGLSNSYTFKGKIPPDAPDDDAIWGVYSKTSDENASILFKNGKVDSISQYLTVQTGPEVTTFFNKLFQELSFRAPLVSDKDLPPLLKNNPLNMRQMLVLVRMEELTDKMKRITLQVPSGNLQILLDSTNVPSVILDKVVFPATADPK